MPIRRLNQAIVRRVVSRAKKTMLRDLKRGVIRPVRSFNDLNQWVEASEYMLNSRGNFDADLQRLAERGGYYDVNVVNDHLNAALRQVGAWVSAGGLTSAVQRPTKHNARTAAQSAAEKLGATLESADWEGGIEDDPSDIDRTMLAQAIRSANPHLSDAASHNAAAYIAARRRRVLGG